MTISARRGLPSRRRAQATVLTVGLAVLAACGGSDPGSATSGPATAGTDAVPSATGTPDPTGTSEPATGGASTTGDQDLTEVAHAELQTPDGTEIGTVTFSTPADDAETLVVRAVVSGLEAGFKGFHVHTIGKCEPDSADPTNPSNVGNFLSAGGHLKAEGENHAGHDGDLTSLQVRSDGTAELLTSTDALPLDALLDADGSAVMVHLGPDNFGNIPTRYAPTPDATTLNTGDSGGRAACGVLEAT